MRKKNKKAFFQLPGTLLDIYSYIVFVLIILLFIMLFEIKGCTEGKPTTDIIESQSKELGAATSLLNYLRTPMTKTAKELSHPKNVYNNWADAPDGKRFNETHFTKTQQFLEAHPEIWQNKTYLEFLNGLKFISTDEMKGLSKRHALTIITLSLFDEDIPKNSKRTFSIYIGYPGLGERVLFGWYGTHYHDYKASVVVPLQDGSMGVITLITELVE